MIRLAKKSDLDDLIKIYSTAKDKMRSDGNFKQWNDKYPDLETLEKDIEKSQLYLAYDESGTYGVFMLSYDGEETYKFIEGKWLNDEDYAVIHRIASKGRGRHVLKDAIDLAFQKTDNIRIDTHNDNKIMRSLLKKLGFTYTGIIYLKNGDERRAYQLIKG